MIARGPKFPQGEPATSNVLLGNFIGTDATGQARIGNFGDGVSISTGSNVIGDASMAGDNVISGNVADGLDFQGAIATGNAVQGNYIGLGWRQCLLGHGKRGRRRGARLGGLRHQHLFRSHRRQWRQRRRDQRDGDDEQHPPIRYYE